MHEFTISNGREALRVIRPLPNESEEDFRRRMEALSVVLAEQAPNLITLIVYDHSGHLVGVVSYRQPHD